MVSSIRASDLRSTQLQTAQIHSATRNSADQKIAAEKLQKAASDAGADGAAPVDSDSTANSLPGPGSAEMKKTFQDFVAGTFFRQMLTSLHQSHDKPAYFHGGQAEEIFQSELDSRIADDLSRRHGEVFAKPLYAQFAQQVLSDGRR